MSDEAPAVVEAPAAVVADAALLTDAPAVEAAPVDPKTESKPEGDKPSGDDGVKPEAVKAEADLLADDDDGKTPAKVDGPADAPKDETPETYEAFTLPEGIQLDEKALAQAMPVFKEFGLTQEKAQKLVNVYAQLQQEAGAQTLAGFNQVKSDWKAQITADPEFGGDRLPQTLGNAKAVLAKFGDKALVNDLREWGWANHPGLIRLLAGVHAHLSEDTLVTADAAAQSAPKSAAEIMWPSMFNKE